MGEEIKKGLFAKLCEAGNAIGWIEKTGRNEFHRYNYATEADLVSRLRGELYSRNVFCYPTVIHQERKPVVLHTMKGDRETALTDLVVRWTFIDADTGESFSQDIPGCGEDSADKGVYKAFTGSEKYCLMKTFLIPTGDDPEAFAEGKAAAQAVADRKIADAKSRAEKGGAQGPKLTSLPSTSAASDELFGGAEARGSLKIEIAPRDNLESTVSGSGLAEMLKHLGERDAHFKAEFMRYDEDAGNWSVRTSKAFILQDFCRAIHVECEFAGELPGLRPPVLTMTRATPKALFMTWGSVDCSCVDQKLWPALHKLSGKPADLIVEEGPVNERTGRPRINVVGINADELVVL